MKLPPIITSAIEQDLYKLSMGQCIFHQFNDYLVTWTFKSRNPEVKYGPDVVREVVEQIKHVANNVRITADEIQWLKDTFEWIHADFIDVFLKHFTWDLSEIYVNGVSLDHATDKIPLTDYGCGLSIEAKGPWLTTTMYEVPILAIVNEVYFADLFGVGKMDNQITERTIEKISNLKNRVFEVGNFADFGLRRRFSATVQDRVVSLFAEHRENGDIPGFVGTSNLHLAKNYGVKAVGTMAHEFAMCVGQGNPMYNPAYSNKLMLDAWSREYGTMNGIALTDTIGTDVFLLDFQKTFCRIFDGVRHDSGDPFKWARKIIANYEKHGIDPKTKTLLFSDALDFAKATVIYRYVKQFANVSFGIGTYLSNPIDDPLNIVMKVTECNGNPVAKISDCAGKGLCKDADHITYLNDCISRRLGRRVSGHAS